jgi:general stress protein YciG
MANDGVKTTVESETPATKVPKPRGFAAMDPERVREIASRGGKRVHELGKGHQFTSDEAREAGTKGGTAPHVSRGAQRKAPQETPTE